MRQRLRWAKGHLQAFGESGWGLFKNIFIDKNTKWEKDDTWYRFLWRTIRHRFMSFDTFAQLLPKQIVTAFKWIVWNLFLFPFTIYNAGGQMYIFRNGTWLSKLVRHFTGNVVVNLEPGWKSYAICVLLVIWIRFFYRIGMYLASIWMAIYIFIIERKRIQKVSFGKKVLYCLTWPLYDVIERYVKYIALFKKVEWKPIPHESKITIDDIGQ